MRARALEETLRAELVRYVSPSEATEGPHGVFRYPAKYLPQIARVLVRELTGEGQRVLDPFAGSGTTLVEAARLARPSIGLDLNPLAVLLGRVKTTRLPSGRLEAEARRVAAEARAGGDAAWPEFPNRDYWFPPASLDPLARLRAAIEHSSLREPLLVAFLSIVKAASNASDYHYKLTRSRTPDPVTGDGVIELFLKRAGKIDAALAGVRIERPAVCVRGDARRLPLPDSSVDAVITHPPYSISFDFVRVYKIYLWWLDADRDTVALDREMVGNQRRLTGEQPRTGIAEIDRLADRVRARSVRDGLAVAWFFADMDRAFREWARVLRPGGALALYMGDSRARGVMIDAPGNLPRLAVRAGFEQLLRLPRPVPRRASSTIRQIHVEEVLVFRA